MFSESDRRGCEESSRHRDKRRKVMDMVTLPVTSRMGKERAEVRVDQEWIDGWVEVRTNGWLAGCWMGGWMDGERERVREMPTPRQSRTQQSAQHT